MDLHEIDESFPPTIWKVGHRHEGWRLDHFLAERIPRLSRTQIQRVIPKRIGLSWTERVTPSTRLRLGEQVYAYQPRLFEVPQDYEFEVLYEDEGILAVNKPPGLVVHPTNSCRENTVIEALRRQRQEKDLVLLHRLDRETSGILLLGRNREMARIWGKAWMRGSIHKEYLARVRGHVEADVGEIRRCLVKSSSSVVNIRRATAEEGEQALTEFKVLRREENTTVIVLYPKTGRRHQLRVHLEWLGHPIVGDPLYGNEDSAYLAYVKGERSWRRMHLHAWRLEASRDGVDLRIEAPAHLFIPST